MPIRPSVRALCAAIALSAVFAATAGAQPKQPTPAALLLAKEIVDIKGATRAMDPLVVGVIEYHKNFLMQTNPNLVGPINEAARKLVGDLSSRKVELQQNVVRIYAQHFTEQELRDALAFYRTPLGKKLVVEEPKAMDEAMQAADEWSRKFAEEVVAKLREELKKKGLNVI